MSECFDAYDRNGQLMNETLYRGESPKQGLYHYVVEIYTVANKKVLITQRSKEKLLDPNLWEVTAGAVIKGERVEEAAIRELAEETGINVEQSMLIELYRYIEESEQVIIKSFGIVLDIEPSIQLQAGETVDYKWITLPEFESRISGEDFVKSITNRYHLYASSIKSLFL